MSFALETALEAPTSTNSFYTAQSPRELAISYRGRRIELRQEYEKTQDPQQKEFLQTVLQKHTKLMIQNNKPLHSYLWKAEKNGHLVYLFGDVHKIVHKITEANKLNEAQNRGPLVKAYLHPQVLEAFESSERLYVEFFHFNHLDWIKKLTLQLIIKYPKAFKEKHPQGDLYYAQFFKYAAGFGSGIVDLLLLMKAGTQILNVDMGSTLGHFVKEMDDLIASKKSIENGWKLSHEGKIPPGWEIPLECIDAVQMGNLHSLTLLYQMNPPEFISDIEERNITYTNCMLEALKQGEKAFFAPGAAHYLGEKGILSLLQKEGVAITRIEMNPENG